MADKLYPVDPATESKFGDQQFDAGYTPRTLDSPAAAKARMLAYMEEKGIDKAGAVAAGLNGSDEVMTVGIIYELIMMERARLQEIDRTADDYAEKVAAAAVELDPAKWLAARPALEKVVALELPSK